YQATNKLVIRTGYGIFYGGDEAGPYSNPSMGFNPPFFISKNLNQPCGTPSANPATVDCSLSGIPTLSSGFPANSLVDPEPPPLFFSLDPKLVTPYMQQWHLSTQYELSSNTVFEVTYAGNTLENIQLVIDKRYGPSSSVEEFSQKAQLAHYEDVR